MHGDMLWLLLLAHFVCDYTFQPDFIAQRKSRANSLPAVPWYYVLTSHAATHAVGVYLVTWSPLLSACEFVCHWVIDLLKSEKLTDIHADQFMHIVCKIVWVILFFAGVK